MLIILADVAEHPEDGGETGSDPGLRDKIPIPGTLSTLISCDNGRWRSVFLPRDTLTTIVYKYILFI